MSLKYNKYGFLLIVYTLAQVLPAKGLMMARAQSSTHYTVVKWVIDQGGGVSSSTNYFLIDAIGQPLGPGVASSTNHRVSMGFLGQVEGITDVTIEDESGSGAELPSRFALYQNYPNPFNPSTTIAFGLPEAAEVDLVLYDILGHEVRRLFSGIKPAGVHTVLWNGEDASGTVVPSGVYFCRMTATESDDNRRPFSEQKKIVFLK